MTLSQYNCPHCSGPFQVDTSLPAIQVACPHCQQPVALTGAPPIVEPPLAEPPLSDPPPPAAVASREEGPPRRDVVDRTITDAYRSRQLVSNERASRKLIKNLIVCVCCAIVLASILAFFLRQGGR